MAKISYEEYKRNLYNKGKQTQNTNSSTAKITSTTKPVSSTGKKPITYDEYIKMRNQKSSASSSSKQNTSPIAGAQEWEEKSRTILSEIDDYYSSWRSDSKEKYTSYNDEIETLLASAHKWRSAYAGNDEAVKAINEISNALSKAKGNVYSKNKHYSQWGSEEEYNSYNAAMDLEKRAHALTTDMGNYYSTWRGDHKTKASIYNKQIDDLLEAAGTWESENLGDKRSREAIESLKKTLADNKTYLKESGEYYSQWDSEGAYKAYIKDKNKLDELNSMAVKDLEPKLKDKSKIAYTTSDGQKITWQQLYDKKKKQEDADSLYNNLSSQPDFQKYVQQGASIKNPTVREAENGIKFFGLDTRPDIGNPVTYSRENWDEIEQESFESGATLRGDIRHTFMDDKQVEIYNYYLAKFGKDRADEYFKSIEDDLTDAKWAKDVENSAKFAKDAPVLASVGSVATSLGSSLEHVYNTGKYALTGEMGKSHMAEITNAVRGSVQEEVDLKIGNWDAFDFVYSTAMSGADSLVAGAVPGGEIILGLSAAAQGTNDALERGLNNRQAFWNGLLNGAAEAIFEHASIGNFKKLKEVPSALGKDIFKNIGKSMLVNASEEALTEIANIAYDTIFNGELAHYSIEDLKNGAWKQALGQVVEAGASGALMGFGFGNMGNAIGYAKGAADAKARYGADPGKLVNEALEVNPNNALAQRMQERLNDDKKVRGGQLLRLEQQTDRTALENDKAKIRQAAFDRLIELGAKEDVELVANALTKQAAGEELTKEEHDLIYKNKYAPRVAEELDPKKLLSGELREEDGYNTEWAEKLGTKRINVEEYSRLVEAAQIKPETAETTADTLPSVSENIAQEGTEATETATISEMESVAENATVTEEISTPELEEGKAILNLGGEVESVDFDSASPISSIKNGRMVLRLADGRTVSADSVTHASEDENLVYKTVQKLAPDTKNANIIVNGFKNSGMDAGSYARAVELVHMYGVKNLAMTDLLKSGSVPKLSAAVRNAAYKAGKITGGREVAAAQARVEAVQGTAKTDGKPGRVLFTDGGKVTGTVRDYIKQSGRVLKPVQEAGLLAMEKLATALKMDLYVYESYRNKNGDLVYIDERGKEVKAPNGKYRDTNGHLYVDLNAGNSGSGTMLFTVAHELTHHIKQWSPAKYRVLANCVVKMINGRGGLTIDQLIAAQQKKAAANGRELTPDEAFDELIADSMETILADGKVIEMMAEIKKQDESLWKKVRDWFKNLAEELKSIVGEYEGRTPDSVEGLMVATLRKDLVNQLEQLYAEALVDASENYQAAIKPGVEGVEVNTEGDPVAYATEDGTVMLSLRTYEEDGRDAFRKYLEKCVKNDKLTKAEMNEMMDDLEGIYTICKDFKDKYAPFGSWSDAAVVRDTRGKPVFSVVTPNGDYKMNLDFSLVCKKRRTLDAVFNEMAKRGIIDDFELGQKSVVKINEMIRKHGFETACALCFVDAKRFRQASMADSFTNLYNELVTSLVPEDQQDQIDHYNFSGYQNIKSVEDGIHTWDKSKLDFSHINHVLKTYGSGTVEYKAANYIKTHAEGRRLLLRGDFMSSEGFDAVKSQNPNILKLYNSKKGTGGPKAAFGDVQYMNEIIKKARTWTPAKAYAVGGVRIQSFSDYVPRMVFDYVQMIYDLAATKLPAHAYTKEELFVKQFGLTGVKINMSLIPAIAEGGIAPGLDADGNYVWAGESFDYETAKEIQNAEGYTENCGTICVGVSHKHIDKLLSDPNIRMVIPYHKSGLNPIVAHMNKIAEFTDYTKKQNTTVKATGSVADKHFDFNAELHKMGENADPKAVIEKYFDWCDENGYDPKFAEFRYHPNYYKLIEDFTLYDKDGKYVPQREVRAVFPKDGSPFGSMKDLIKAGLEEDAIVEGKRDKSLGEIVDEIERTLPKTEAEIAEEQVEQADRDLEAEEIKNTANEDGVKNSLRMSTADIQAVQNIGRISVNQFTTADIKATERLARQYWSEMGAKSPFFRAWFGDWRVNDPTRIKVADQPGNSRGVQKNDDTGWDIQVSGKVFTETRVHTDSYNIAARPYLPYINDIVKKAVLLDSFGVDTNKPKSVNSLLVHSLYAVADIGTGPEVIKLYVEEMNNPNSDGTDKRAYQLQNIEKYQPTGKSSQKTASSISPVAAGTIRTVADLFADVKQKDGSFNPNSVSAITNADGTPKIMYHGSPAQFTVFDKKKAKSSGLYGRGFYFTDSETHAGTYGQKYSVYLNIRNPLESGKATVTRAQVKAYLEEVADNDDYSIENYGTYDIDTILRNVMGSASKVDAFKVIQDINVTAIGDMVEAAELFNTVNGTDFDGIVVSTETVAFKPEQIKSATDNIGTFDKNNPDIRYSERDGVIDSLDAEWSRITSELHDVQTEMYKAEDTYKELQSNGDLLDAMFELISAEKRTPEYKAAKAKYKEIAERLGVAEAEKRKSDLTERYTALKKAEENVRIAIAEAKETAAIAKSGLTEAEYFRKSAVKNFGYTPMFLDAGYMLPNGKLLNFSGEKGKHFGVRGEDHRGIGIIYENTSGSAAMVRFMNDGNIRVMAETPGVDISSAIAPTNEQYAAIKRFVREYAKEKYFAVDISDKDGRSIGNYEYHGTVNPDRVVNDIKYFFQTGEVRESSSIAQFHYSDRDSAGNELSTEQQAFFADSKVRDKDGKLIPMYHGTSADRFTIFERRPMVNGKNYGDGFYFTEDKDAAYRWGSKNVYEVYVDLKNPYIASSVDGETPADIAEIVKAHYGKTYDRLSQNADWWGSKLSREEYIEKNSRMWRNPDIALLNAVEDTDIPYENDAQYYGEIGKRKTALLESLGYDGVLVPSDRRNQTFQEIVAFNSEQIKEITNTAPTADPDIRFSDRDGESVSNRALLANAFEGAVTNDIEKAKLEEYKGTIDRMNAEEQKLQRLNAKIKELSFAKGARDTARIEKLRTEAQKAANRINTYDKQLLRFEASKPLQNVLEREKAKAYARAEKKGKAALKKQREGFEEKSKQMQKELSEKYREKKQALVDKHHDQIAALKEKHTEQRENERDRRNKTAMRGKIRKVIGELDKLLNHGNKKTNVKAGMREFVAGAVSSAEVLFKDEHTDVDMVRDGIGVTLSEEEQLQYDKAREILSKMDKLTESNANALAEKTKLEGQLSYRLSKLKEALHRERIRINEAVVSDALGTLADEYEKLRDSEYAYVKGAFSESVYNYIKLLQRDIGGAKIKDMTLGQLEDLYKAYRMALTTVRDANKAFVASKSVDEIVENLVTEVERRKMPKTKAAAIARNLSNKIGWDYEKLYYALQRIGSNTLTELFTNLANAEDIVLADVKEANAKKMEIVKKYGYNNWNVDQKLNKVFTDTTGKRFQMTLGELMSLYAYSRRAGAWNHIEYGGFVFNKTALTDTDPVTTYKLNKEQCEAITNTLTEKQKHFVEEMQTFLSDTMGAKGNEVSMKLYGVEMFGEKNYFPVHVAGQFMVKAQESQAKAAAGFSSMTNAGFTQAQNKKAKAPFIMESFMDVWADHVNEMSRYHGTVPALEDIRKVMNYSSYSNAYAESVSVQAILENKYGKKAVQYFNDLYQEANSGAITDKLQKPAQKWISKFRKNSVAYSASVLIQQPASIVRAYAMLPMKYFRGKGVLSIPAGVGQAIFNNSAYKKAYGEMLKYAPGVTLSKEIGGFDTASGNSIRTYLLDTGKNIKQKWKTETDLKGRFNTVMDVVDDNPIANLPNVADKIAWIEIWNACKRETAAKNRDMETNSDAFMKLVGERFTEVIRATQVYDSMFSKSPLLKSNNMFVQSLVSFMNEPNTTANMVENAIRTAARGDRKTATRTITAVAGSVVFTCVLKSLVYAMRDEDEDKKYIEKYLGELTDNLISDFTVFNYIPYARDVWSLAQGFDVERSDMAIISDAMNSLKELATLAAKDTDEMTEDELIEFDKKVIKAHMSMLDSVCAAFGIPEKNIRREIKAILNTAGMLYKKSGGKASWASIEDSVLEGVKGASPSFMGPKIQSKGDKLYEAVISGDTAYADRLKGTYKDEDAVTSAIRKALGNNEPRILKAAELLVAQDYDEGLDLIDEIVDEGKFTWNDVVSAVNTKVNKLTEDESDEDTAEKTKSAVDAKAYINAILNGSSEDIAEVRESILYTKIENGKTEDEAKESLVSSAKTELKERYIAEEISKPQVLSAMKTIGADKVEETVNKWTCEVATGISYEDQMAKYKAGNTSVSEYGRILTKYGGLSEEKAAEKIVEDSKAAYKDGTFDRNKMVSILINYGGKDSAKAESTVQYMDYKLSHPDISVDDAWIDKYNSEVKDSGINLDMYIEYKNQVKSIDGEGKKERRMAVIHSLPISNAQKDALYYSEGWTQSRIHEAPWH